MHNSFVYFTKVRENTYRSVIAFVIITLSGSEDFADGLGLLIMYPKDFQNFCNLEINWSQIDLNGDLFNLNAYQLCFYYQEYQFSNLLDG